MESAIARLKDYLITLRSIDMSSLTGHDAKNLIIDNLEHEVQMVELHPNLFRECFKDVPCDTLKETDKT